MANLEESFPRGGTRKSHKAEKPSQQAAEPDNLFDVSGMLLWRDLKLSSIFGKIEPHLQQIFSSLFLFDVTFRN